MGDGEFSRSWLQSAAYRIKRIFFQITFPSPLPFRWLALNYGVISLFNAVLLKLLFYALAGKIGVSKDHNARCLSVQPMHRENALLVKAPFQDAVQRGR